jgi:hypothetical protein
MLPLSLHQLRDEQLGDRLQAPRRPLASPRSAYLALPRGAPSTATRWALAAQPIFAVAICGGILTPFFG